jgi:YHS domain-containing protein
VVASLVIMALEALAAAPVQAADPVNTTFFGNLALKGYDPVAYFVEGRPVKGSGEHRLEWNGATWRFASEANRVAFAADPERYAPQYGGYCAWAVSQGYTADIDPEAWRIVDGKLYLNYSTEIQARWAQDIQGNIAAADASWPKLVDD